MSELEWKFIDIDLEVAVIDEYKCFFIAYNEENFLGICIHEGEFNDRKSVDLYVSEDTELLKSKAESIYQIIKE